jgi:hypothetical protein
MALAEAASLDYTEDQKKLMTLKVRVNKLT